MSGQRVILLIFLGIAVIVIIAAIAASCLERPELREDARLFGHYVAVREV
jgi:hypothetical protein